MQERPSFNVPGNLHYSWDDGFKAFQAAIEYASKLCNVQLRFPWSVTLHNLDEDNRLGKGIGGYVSFRVSLDYALSLSPLPPLRERSAEIVLARGLPTDFAFDAIGEELYHLQFFTPNLVLNEAYGRLGFYTFTRCRESQLELVVEDDVVSLDLGEGIDLAHEVGYKLCDHLIEETDSDFAVVDDLLRYHTLAEIAEISGMSEQDLDYGPTELRNEYRSVSIKDLWSHALFHHRFINKEKLSYLPPRSVRRFHKGCIFREWRSQRA